MKFLLFFSLMFGHIHAQTFYFSPTLSNKICIGSTSFTRFSDKVHNISDYYDYDNRAFVTKSLSSINLGLLVGFKPRNNKLKFEIGWSQDEVLTGFEIRLSPYNNEMNSYGQGTYFLEAGTTFQRYYGLLKFNLFETINSPKFQFGYILGIKPNFKYGKFASGTTSFPIAEDEVLNIYYNYVDLMKFKHFINFGIDQKINFHKNYLFSLSIFFNLPIGRFEYMSHSVFIEESNLTNGNIVSRSFQGYSKGAGVYFQIHRAIDINKTMGKFKKS